MIPYIDVYEAKIKYEVRESGVDQPLWDVVLDCDAVDGDIHIHSNAKSDLEQYQKGQEVMIAYLPNGQQQYRILNMPPGENLARQIQRKRNLFMEIYRQLPSGISEEVRQDIATTIYLDQRNRGDNGPLDEENFE